MYYQVDINISMSNREKCFSQIGLGKVGSSHIICMINLIMWKITESRAKIHMAKSKLLVYPEALQSFVGYKSSVKTPQNKPSKFSRWVLGTREYP